MDTTISATPQQYGFEIRMESPSVDLGPLWPRLRNGMRTNRRTGRVLEVTFPKPYDMRLFDGECVRGPKAARLRAIVAAMQAEG